MVRAAHWISGSFEDFQRLREINSAATRARLVAMASIVAVAPLVVGRLGWWIVPIATAYFAYGRFVDFQCGRSRWGQAWMLSLAVVTQALFAVTAASSGGPQSPALVWLVLGFAIAPARYNAGGVAFVFATTLACLAAASLSAGAQALLNEPGLPLATLSTVIGCAACGLAARRSELSQRHAAAVDPLTGLLNRASLASRFEATQAHCTKTGDLTALLICDLDRFKQINDLYGHAAGDAVLRATASCLQQTLPDRMRVYRLGGEEFGVLLAAASREQAHACAELVRTTIAAARPGDQDITASVGIATTQHAQTTIEELFAAADAAMYQAKAEGRNRALLAPPTTKPQTAPPHLAPSATN